MTVACIGLGGNIGDRTRTLADAVAALAATPGLALISASSFHQTNPIGGPGGQGAYLNAAAVVESSLVPLDLLRALQVIERGAGRVRRERWGERTLDLDLLLCGPLILRTAELMLPHPLMAARRFVLAPLAEVARDVIHPTTGRTVADLLANLDRRPSRVEIVDADDGRRGEVANQLSAILEASDWDVGGSGDSTFRVVVGETLSEIEMDGVPTVLVEPAGAEAIAAYIAILCQATRGA